MLEKADLLPTCIGYFLVFATLSQLFCFSQSLVVDRTIQLLTLKHLQPCQLYCMDVDFGATVIASPIILCPIIYSSTQLNASVYVYPISN